MRRHRRGLRGSRHCRKLIGTRSVLATEEFPEAPPGLPADLTRTLGWLRSHLSEPVQLDLLAQIAGVRPRTLETHFKMFLGTTPLGWVRRMRLARARQDLLHARPPTSVTDVALANGFSQLGRFAGQYRRLFGELPSATLQRSTNLSTSDPDLDEAARLTLGALPLAFGLAAKSCNAALEELERPQELAPIYGLPKAVAAWCWGQRAAHGFGSTPDVDRQRANSLGGGRSRRPGRFDLDAEQRRARPGASARR